MPFLTVIALGTLYGVLSVPFTACTRSAAESFMRNNVIKTLWWASSIGAPFCSAATVVLGIVPWSKDMDQESAIIVCFAPILVNIFMVITTINVMCLFPSPPVVHTLQEPLLGEAPGVAPGVAPPTTQAEEP